MAKFLIPIYLTSLFTILADTPHVSDCSELERLGINQNGYYYIDPSGQRQNSELSLVYCDNDGWTHILKREHDPSLTYVSWYSSILFRSQIFWVGWPFQCLWCKILMFKRAVQILGSAVHFLHYCWFRRYVSNQEKQRA